MRPIFHFFFHTLAGWRIQDERPAGLDRYIVVVAPHTSNWDFFVGLCVRSLARMGDVKYLAKKSLFKPPLGWWFKAIGGYPVDRSKHNNLVDAVVAMFDSGEISKIGITPEGTRRYQPEWKTGFHRMATGAKVPIILATFDYPRKLVILTAPFPLTDDPEADIVRMKDWFRPHKGKNPEDGVR
ncbi:MAG: 1-acyl-sn-glycerol-3-phosphate acyltransferase [Flavobacteriales bacterium]|nr:1-acyl-sn-glycerol-3-phosphate acyltransferase [Flavobacteriales bacterium]